MEESQSSSSIKKRLSMQAEILKRVEEFSERMQKRAGEVTIEVHGLVDHAGTVEQDLRNTFNAFRNLSNLRFIENRISDEDDFAYNANEAAKSSVEGSIPAQSYEADILPRYKEALSLGLTSYRNHLTRTNKSYSTGSAFKHGSAQGLLPHIIGSEEYTHDNSCGLIDDTVLGAVPLDFNSIMEPRGATSDANERSFHDLFSANLFGMEQGPSEKVGTEPLVSAALDFKAMLEAALLNPYKFYDDDSSSTPEAVSINDLNDKQRRQDLDQVTLKASHTVTVGTSQGLNDTEDTNVPVSEGNLTSRTKLPVIEGNLTTQGFDPHPHKLYSALLSGSLFDTEESLPSCQKQTANISASFAEPTFGCADITDDEKFAASPHDLPGAETLVGSRGNMSTRSFI